VPTFSDLGVPADLVDALRRRNITEPFPVQAATIADMLNGVDVCGKAPTGSGKTLAFGIPLVERVAPARPRRPRALVLAPTRELAAQIQMELEPLAAARDKRVCTVYGGVGYEKQKKALRRGVEILVACPGRLRDLMAQRAVRLDAVDMVVIDEADRMADMGFLPEVRKILDETSPNRQTMLFSATLDGDVAVLQREYQRDDVVTHEIAAPEDADDTEHHFEELELTERVTRAAELVRAHGSTIVFTRTRRGAERLAKQLTSAGVDAAAIHGGLSQSQRDRALAGFKRDNVEALIATDVAARGIHVDAVACVVHFDPPDDAKTYVHRSGRTARAGATGTVVSFVAPDQRAASRRLRKEIGLLPASSEPDRRRTDPRRADRHGRNRATASRRSGSGRRQHRSGERRTAR
jgi:superfamily II DNA/RNA helicase